LEREHRSLTGEERSAREVALADGEAMQRYIERLARALAGVVNVLDPDVIVLGGGLSNIDRLYREVPALWTRYIFSDHVTTRLLRNVHGDSSGVRGAARLWNE
ncbi:MAG: ROK family protein, partial [Betaproteobacteria bacterium]|nr:ROK family protein [Betaproteobacteria bacterium]